MQFLDPNGGTLDKNDQNGHHPGVLENHKVKFSLKHVII